MLAFYLTLVDDEPQKTKFEKIYYLYRERMTAVAVSVLGNVADAEDAVHNAFVGVAKNMDSVGDVDSPQTLSYVLKAAKNSALNILRGNRYVADNEKIEDIPDEEFFERLDVKERYNQVVKAITELDEKYRDVLFYHYVCDMPVAKVAEILGRKVPTVKQQLVRGKKILIENLGDDFYD